MTDASTATINEIQDQKLVAHIKKSLTELNYTYSISEEEENIIQLTFKGKKFEYKVIIFCGAQFLTIHCALPLVISEDKFPKLLNHINELNIKIPLGNYELHPNSNKFIYKIGSHIPPMLNKDELENIVSLAVSFTDLSVDEVLKITQ